MKPDVVGLSRRSVALGRVAALAAVLTGGNYLWWRRDTLRDTGVVGVVFLVAELLTFASVLFTAVVLGRARRTQEPELVPPTGSLDVFITVCGEPVEMVESTLRAALDIRYPHATYLLNDGRIAGRPGWQQIDALAARYGVPCFTRATGRRGKAANLNYALARTGGDFVVTLDADHVAEPDLAHQTLGYFRRLSVAFVATRQAFRTDAADALNNEERLFYRALQPAKDRDGCAFSCGNGTVYRRYALLGIGGFSEWNVVEDLHTSYLLHADGWRSVYHPRAVTVGTAPETAAEYLAQRSRWALDSLRLLLWDSPLRRPGLRFVHRLHYLHTTASYLFAATQVLFVLAPPLTILTGVRILTAPSQASYLAHVVPYLLSNVAFLAAYAGFRGAVRTLQSTVFNAPGYLFAVLRALGRRAPESGATRKVRQARFSFRLLPATVLVALLAAALATVVLRPAPGRSYIAAGWTLVMAWLIVGPFTAVGGRARVSQALRIMTRGAAVASVTAAVAIPHVGPPGSLTDIAKASPKRVVVPARASQDHPTPSAPQQLVAAPQGVYLGATAPSEADPAQGITQLRQRTGALQIVHWFQQWGSGDVRFRGDWLTRVADQGAVPMITWEPWAKPTGKYTDANQANARLAVLLSGRYDTYIKAWARAAAAYRRPILIRLMHEMNGNWYPWSVTVNGNTPALYVAAFRRVHDLFTQAGATNVSWVWSINTFYALQTSAPDISTFYPGDRYVDWVSVGGLNWGTTATWSRWSSGRQIFDRTLTRLAQLGKPIMISEVATVTQGGDAAAWVHDFLDYVATAPAAAQVKAVVWFDRRYTPTVDFRLTDAEAMSLRAGLAAGNWAPALRVIRAPEPAPPSPAPVPLAQP